MGLEVRQRSYAFGQRGKPNAVLETGDVATCMGLVVIDREQGLGFMAHYDLPWLDSSVEAGLKELWERVSDPARVEVYDIMGLERRWLLLGTTVFWVFIAWVFTRFNQHGFWNWFLAALIGVGLPMVFLTTRWRVRRALKRLGFPAPVVLCKRRIVADTRPGWRRALSMLRRKLMLDTRINVLVDLNRDGPPAVSFPARRTRDDRFLVLPMAQRQAQKLGRWLMHQTPGSA